LIEETKAGVRFVVRVTPRASRTQCSGFDAEGRLRVRIAAPPVDGEANAALVEWLARLLKCPKSRVRITHGTGGRTKTIEIEAVTRAAVEAALNV